MHTAGRVHDQMVTY